MRRSNASSSSSDVHVSPRIVSLVPSSTETLLSLGAPVTACTRFCEQPGIPHVGGTKNPDIERIIELAPDFVVMDREENRREDADTLAAAGIELFVSDVTTVDAAEQVVIDLADRAGRPRPDSAVPPSTAPAGRDRIRAHLASTVDVDQPVDLRRRPARPARHRARHRRITSTPIPPSNSTTSSPGIRQWCSYRASRTSSGTCTSTSCALPSVRACRWSASTDATCSGGAAGPRAPWPASAPNSPRSSRDLLRCA